MKNFNLIKRLWTDSHEKQSPQRFGRYAAILVMLLTLGVGQMWAAPWVKLDVSTGSQGTKTVGDKLNGGSDWWFNYQTNGGWSSGTDIQVIIGTSSSSYSTVDASWYADDGGNKKVHANIGSFTFDKSGKWYAVGKYKSSSTTAYTSGTSFTNNTSLSTSMSTSNSPYWTVNPPSVKSFTVSTTGSDILSGTGTSGDPYIIAYNGSLVLTLSGSKNKTDANSSLQYNTSGSWNTTTSRTISGITSTTKTSVTVKMRCYNSTASLSGTESSKTIYYKSEASYNVTAAKTPSAGGSVTPTSATAMGTTSGGNITASPNTGYTFTSWAITSGSGYFGTTGTATTSTTANTKFRPSAATTVTATFTPKTYSITLDGNGGSDGSATATYNSSTLTSVTHCSRASYDLNGYYTATSGGTKVINANGTLVASVSTYTNSSSQWIKDADVELHAQWTYNPVTYSVTYAVGTGYTSYGSLSAKNTSTSAAISSGSSLESGTGVTFTATPNTGYVVEGWYTNAACTSGKHDAGSTTYSTTLSGNITVYVKFVEKTWSVAFAAGTGGTVTTPNSTPQTVGQVTGISIAATPGTGYTFASWSSSSGGSFTSGASTNSNTFKPTANTTVTASFNETMSSLSTSNSYDAGNPSYAAPAVTGSYTNVGYATTRTITATAAGTGYTFAGWTLTNCTRTDGGAATATSITIRSNGDGAAATVVANYTEVLTTVWYLTGSFNSWSASANKFAKRTGESTGSVAYTTIDLPASTPYEFGVNNGSSYYSNNNGSSETYYIKESVENWTFEKDLGYGVNCHMKTTVAGTYTFKIDFSASNPKISVTYPVSYTLSYDIGTVKGNNGSISTSPSTASGSKVISGTEITLTAPAAKTGYTWKGWYTNAGGTEGKITDTNRAITVTMNADKTLYACYTENQYNVAVSAGAGGSVSPTGTVAVKQVNGTSLTATPSAGYSFANWTISGGGITPTTSSTSPQTFKATTTGGSIQANFSEVMRTVSVVSNNTYLGSVSAASLTSVGPATKSAEVTATPETGATFTRWDVVSGITIADGYTNTSNPVKINATAASKTLTAVFTETKHTVTLSTADGSKGTVGSNQSVGRITAVQITATPKSGYMFSKWVKTAGSGTVTYYTGAGTGQVTDASGDEKETTYITVTGNVTLQATWEPDRSSGYVVHYGNSGKNADGGSDPSQARDWKDGKLYRATTEASDVSYFTFTAGVGDVDKTIYFKIWETSSSAWDHWYGYNSNAGGKITGNVNEATLSTSYGDARLCITMPGNYVFTWNSDDKTLSVAYPTNVYYLRGGFNGWSWDHPMTETSSGVYSATVNMTEANHTYSGNNGFKLLIAGQYYGKNSTTVTRSTSTGSAAISGCGTSGANIGITTDYTGNYTFTYTVSTNTLQVTYPTAYKITFGKGSVNGSASNCSAVNIDNGSSAVTSNSTWVKSGHRVVLTAPDAKTGYRFLGWYDNDAATGDAITTLANCTITVNTDKTVYACYALKQSALTFDYLSSAEGYGADGTLSSVSATYGAAMPALSGSMPTAANGYAFMGFYDETGGAGKQYYDGTGASVNNWDKDKTTGTTLYAYYKKAEITALTFDAGTVEPEATVGVTPTISPTPVGTTIICWTILHSNDTPLDPQPSMTWSDGKLTFAASTYSGTYKVQAVLRTGNDCSGGTSLDTETASFLVAGSHTVTVNYKCGDDVIKAATSVTGGPTDWSDDITAPDIFGYTFSSWSSADGVTIKDSEHEDVTSSTEATIKIKAIYAGSLTANYTQKQMIYFKNTLGWENVYVNFYTGSYWNNPKGSGNNGVTNQNLAMTQYGETDIWYYDYGAASITPSLYVSFTSKSQSNSENFWKAGGVNVVYPANYQDNIHTNKSSENGFKEATPMFVPLATQEKVTLNQSSGGKADYYNAGYWTKYLPGTGYRLEIYDNSTGAFIKAQDFTSADELMPMKAVVDLEGGTTYKFQLRRGGESSAGVYYGNSGTMTYTNHGQDTPWAMTNEMDPFKMVGITTNAAGDYTFNLSYSPNSTNQYRLRIAVDYPVKSGDYRLVYKDDVHTNIHPSAIVSKVNDGTDIVSFFVRHDQNPKLYIQQATVNPSTGAITWNEYPNSGTPTNQITGDIASAIESTDVYNFNLSMDGEGAMTVASAEIYEGNFYIRTDAANSKWDNYRTDPDHRMTYSEYSITHGGYTHYYTHWVDKDVTGRKNVKFVIANDYSPCISDTLTRETATGTWANIDKFIEEGGDLKRSANVRFMWDKRSNTISRAYIDGAQNVGSDNFLYMLNMDTPNKIRWDGGSALTSNKVTFTDKGNWMYEANIEAQPTAQIRLLSNWGTSPIITQYFRGSSSTEETLVGGSGDNWYDIRVIYDFKTNRLIAGLVPSGTIDDQIAINADVMFIREHQGDIAQLTFAEKDEKMGAITDIETAYGVLQFNKWTINNKSKADGHSPLSPLLSAYERDLFYVSFPFRVSMEEVFGFGTYGTHWIIEEYDGASRAANGYWQESGPNWKFVFNRKNKFFEPGQGYIIALDLDELGESSDVWTNTDQVELYFPSYGTMDNITSSTATYEIPSHLCTINRTVDASGNPTGLPADYDRRVKDSHWNVLGVPTYVNPLAPNFANTDWTTSASETSIGPNFLYEWNMTDNSVSAVSASGYTYHAMHAYLVQYCGDVTWTSSVSVAPSDIVARRMSAEKPQNVEFKMELSPNDKMVDQTFIKLSDDENVTTGFEFNYDLSKEFNANKANIYTLIAKEPVAGNVLPLTEQITVIPVGVKIAANGDYTFAIPEGTKGIGVVLIDNIAGTRTNLGLMDYTVTLPAGKINDRFLLEISPIVQSPTDLENTEYRTQNTEVRKVMIDGILYIVKDGIVYDAQGHRVQ